MQIILKRTKCFSEGQKLLTVSPSSDIQTVPEWVRNTATFRLGLQDKSIQEVEVKPVPASIEAIPAPAAAKPVQPPIQVEKPAAQPAPQSPAKNRK